MAVTVPQVQAVKGTPKGHVLSEGGLAVLRDLPEVCGVAGPGGEVDGVKAAEHHYLIRFWPMLCMGEYAWELGAPLLFDIDTTAPADTTLKFTRVARLRMGKDGEFRSDGLHGHAYDSPSYALDYNGACCRGSAKWVPEPFAAALMCRAWAVQCLENRAEASRQPENTKKWWREQGPAWLQRYPLAKAVIVPSAWGAKLAQAKTVPLDVQWVERILAGDRTKPLPYTAPMEAVLA